MKLFKTFVFVINPIAINLALAIIGFFFNFDDFSHHHWLCYMAVLSAIASVIISFIGFAIHDLGPKRTLAAVLIQAVALIFIFAAIYRGYGLIYNNSPISIRDDWQTSLYFSVVTWTTLGYGDFSPRPEIRLIAAIQAILGYVLFGVSVGMGTYLMSQERTTSQSG